jgi:hypothetical protein
LIKDTKKTQINGKITLVHDWKNIVKLSILCKAIYRFNAMFSKILMSVFTEIEKKIPKCIWDQKDPKYTKQLWTKSIKVAELHYLVSNKATVIKTA